MSGIRLGARAVPANPLVAYTLTKTGDGFFEVWAVTESPGQDPYAVLADGETDQRHNPVPSPDGSKVAFEERNASGFYEIHVCDADGSNEVVLDTSVSTFIQFPAWKPDGQKIIYTISDVGANSGGDVYEILPDGTGKTLLHSPATDYCAHRPVYNSDGTKIAFIRVDDGAGTPPPGTTRELWVMDADGSNATSIKTLDAIDSGQGQFAWANASDVLAYYTGSPTDQVRKINADGTGDTLLNIVSSGGLCAMSQRAWSPDDTKVYCSSFESGALGNAYYIKELLADGSAETVLYDTHVPYSVGHARTPWVFGSRIYFLPASRDELSSIALDGTDYRVEDDFSADYDQITFGTGLAYL